MPAHKKAEADAPEKDEHKDRVFEKPKATIAAEEAARKTAEEVLEIQKEVMDRNRTNVPAENVQTAYSTPADDDTAPESITFALDGSNVTVVATTTKPMVFSRQDYLGLVNAASKFGASL